MKAFLQDAAMLTLLWMLRAHVLVTLSTQTAKPARRYQLDPPGRHGLLLRILIAAGYHYEYPCLALRQLCESLKGASDMLRVHL